MRIRQLSNIVAFAAGAAVTAGAIAISVGVPAGAAPGLAESTFVPITPCRLFDTRPGADNVGPRDAPIRQQPHIQQVTGTNGDCTIPADATAVAMNVTTVNASASSFVQFYPADVTRPKRGSNLNVVAGQAPTPNKVDAKLSATGAVAVFNRFGTVDVLADVVGFYTSSGLQDLAADVLAKADSADVYTRTQVDAAVGAAIATLPRTFGAVVRSDGTFARGVGAVSANRVAPGAYTVRFPIDVSACVYSATPGEFGQGSIADRIATVAPSAFSNTDVFVRTQDATSPSDTDSSFHLAVICPPV